MKWLSASVGSCRLAFGGRDFAGGMGFRLGGHHDVGVIMVSNLGEMCKEWSENISSCSEPVDASRECGGVSQVGLRRFSRSSPYMRHNHLRS